MGIRPERVWGDLRDYILCTMRTEERRIAQEEAMEAAGAVELILTEGVAKAMTRFNRKVPPEEATG